MRRCALYLFATLIGWSGTQIAVSQNSDIKNYVKTLTGKALIIRNFYTNRKLIYNSDGVLQEKPEFDGWAGAGVRIDEEKMDGDKLELKGRRIRSVFNAKTGDLQSFPTDEKMEIRVVFDKSPLDQAVLKKALDQIFLTKDDKLNELIASACKAMPQVTAPRAIFAPDPSYTDDARQRKVQGIVKLWVIVSDAGIVSDVQLQKSLDTGLDAEAIKTVSTWRFQPATKNCKPAPVKLSVDVNFSLR